MTPSSAHPVLRAVPLSVGTAHPARLMSLCQRWGLIMPRHFRASSTANIGMWYDGLTLWCARSGPFGAAAPEL